MPSEKPQMHARIDGDVLEAARAHANDLGMTWNLYVEDLLRQATTGVGIVGPAKRELPNSAPALESNDWRESRDVLVAAAAFLDLSPGAPAGHPLRRLANDIDELRGVVWNYGRRPDVHRTMLGVVTDRWPRLRVALAALVGWPE